MTTLDDNIYGVRIANSTVYHTADAVQILRRVLEQTNQELPLDTTFKVIYPSSYKAGARANWQDHNNTLYLSLPRRSKVPKASALTALAGAYIESEDDTDDYIFYANKTLVKEATERLSKALWTRGVPVDSTGLQLRYCHRLSKKQKETRKALILELELEELEAEKIKLETTLEELVVTYRREIDAARAASV